MNHVSISIRGIQLELDGYDPSATIMDLAREVEAVRPAKGLITAGCAGCGICCGDTIPIFREDIERLAPIAGMSVREYIERFLDLPQKIDPDERKKAIHEQARLDGLTVAESTLLYDFNVGDPLSPKKGNDGKCSYLDSNLCTIYSDRPFICMLYVCNADDRLSSVHSNIVRQGIWDSYRAAGWIKESDIPFNPFTRYDALSDIPIAEFEYDMTSIMEKLADYF